MREYPLRRMAAHYACRTCSVEEALVYDVPESAVVIPIRLPSPEPEHDWRTVTRGGVTLDFCGRKCMEAFAAAEVDRAYPEPVA